VLLYDSLYGIDYPSISGQDGGGNAVHSLYGILGTPTIVVITPDKLIATHQIFPPTTGSVVDSILLNGGEVQPCITGVRDDNSMKDHLVTVRQNPFSGEAYIDLDPARMMELEIKILDITGQCVARQGPSVYGPGSNTIRMDLHDHPAGMYLLMVSEKGQLLTKRKLIYLSH